MNEETKDAMEALGVKPGEKDAGGVAGAEVDYKAKYEEAMRKLESARVEEGRVRKLDAELKVAKSRVAELEKGAALGSLPDNIKEAVPDEMKEAALLLSQGVVDKAMAGQMERLEQLERQRREDMKRHELERAQDFVARLNAKFPDFLKGIKADGALRKAWDAYQVYNAESIKSAVNTCDFERMSYHVQNFYNAHGIDPSGGRGEVTAPDPRTLGGGDTRQPAGDSKKQYTEAEYQALTEKARRLREEYRFDEYRKLSRELEDAWTEGRVKKS